MKVSIVITAYNVEQYINECIQSVLNQTYTDWDLFIVEDCSTDNTKAILENWDDPRINIIYNKNNIGPGAGRKKGIQYSIDNSDSEYILLLDGDDWLTPTFIESLVHKAMETNADIVSGGITIKHPDGVTDTTSYGEPIMNGPDKVFKFWGERIVFMNNKLIRKSLHQLVPYCERRYIEDTPTIIPQLYYANKVAYADNVGYVYRMRDKSLTHEADDFKNALFRALCAKDLIVFFSDKEEEYSKFIDLKAAYLNELKNVKNSKYTIEDAMKYPKEFIELGMCVLGDLNL